MRIAGDINKKLSKHAKFTHFSDLDILNSLKTKIDIPTNRNNCLDNILNTFHVSFQTELIEADISDHKANLLSYTELSQKH